MKKILLTLCICAMMTFVAATAAQAIVFNFTSDHCSTPNDGPPPGCGTPPFGDVTLTQSGTTVDVTVHLFSPNEFVKTGSADFQAFKFNATGVVLGDITVDAHTPSLSADSGSFNGDGTGNFGFGIICSTCGNGAGGAFSPDIVFHVASATIADLTAPNNLGNVFVADIISLMSGGGTGNTGPVDATTSVPEPTTILLLGFGLAGLGFVRRRKS